MTTDTCGVCEHYGVTGTPAVPELGTWECSCCLPSTHGICADCAEQRAESTPTDDE